VKALLEEYCDDAASRRDLFEQTGVRRFPPEYTRPGFMIPITVAPAQTQQLLRYNQPCRQTNCPYRVEGLWIMTELPGGDYTFPKNWIEILDRVQVDVFGAARELDLLDIEPIVAHSFRRRQFLIQTIQSASQEPENQARHSH